MEETFRRNSALPAIVLAAILVAEGYASLATEILALRRMVPWAGSAVSVTAVLLAVYLAALAGGYRRGGLLARRGDPRPRLAVRLSVAGALAAFWLSDLGTLAAFGLPLPPLAQVAVYSIVGIAPVGWLLAESVLLAHACAPAHEPSEKAGGIFAVSTAGNVLGAMLTTFVLLRFLGIAAAAMVLVAGLFLAAAMASLRSIPRRGGGRAGGLPGAGPVDRSDPVRGAERLRGLPDRRPGRWRPHARGFRTGSLAPRRARAGLGLRRADRTDPVRGGRDTRAGAWRGRDDPRQGGSVRAGRHVRGHRSGPGADRRGVPRGACWRGGPFRGGRRTRVPARRRRGLGGDPRRHVLEQPDAPPAPAHCRVLPPGAVADRGRRVCSM